jgi:hypothetical protein
MAEPMIQRNVQLRHATPHDFFHRGGGGQENVRNVGMHYWIENSKGEMECYRFTEATDTGLIKPFIAEGRCYVFQEA